MPQFGLDTEETEPMFFELKKFEKFLCEEKEYPFDAYINQFKLVEKMVYNKFPNQDSEGRISTENILNLKSYFSSKKKKKKNKNPKPELSSNINETSLSFESKFESGNLQLVFQITENKYQLFLHNDTNTTGYSQWFFFRVMNTKKNKKITFQIMNLLRKRTKYNYGIKIWVYSVKKNLYNKKNWHHTEEDVKYYKNTLYRTCKGKRQYFYTLSFDYTFEYDDDEVYFANCIPYTYTDIMKHLNELQKYENTKYPYFTRKTLCTTLAGNDVDYITINNSDIESSKEKEGIVLFARQHPSETVGSWVIKGAIDMLFGESDEAKYLRDNFIFKIIPMINPDGVICGNTRTSIAGCDLNRRWINPSDLIHPEIYYAKEMIMKFAAQRKINCIVDFHGHFGAFNSFFYANRDKENFSKGKFFPYACGEVSNCISFERSRFSMPKYKKGTGRIDLFNELGTENIVTLESSYFGCVTGKYQNQYFTTVILEEMGRDVCLGILYNYYYTQMNLGFEIRSSFVDRAKEIEKNFNNYISKVNGKKEEIEKELEEKDEKDKEENKPEDKNISDNESDSPEKDDEDSESEPSLDNIDINEIKKLLPSEIKKKNRNKKVKKTSRRTKVFQQLALSKKIAESQQGQNSSSINITTVNQVANKTQISLPKLQISKTPKIKDTKMSQIKEVKNYTGLHPITTIMKMNPRSSARQNSINEKNTIDSSQNNNINDTDSAEKPSQPKESKSHFARDSNDPNMSYNLSVVLRVSSETQTEEIYFKMHWSYFLGTCTIMTAKFTREDNFKGVRSLNGFGVRGTVSNFYMQGFSRYGFGKKKISSQRIPLKISQEKQNNFAKKGNNELVKSFNTIIGKNHQRYGENNQNLNLNFNFYSLANGAILINKVSN